MKMHTRCRFFGWGLALAAALCISRNQVRASALDSDMTFALLNENGVVGFAEAIRDGQVEPISIPSKKSCDVIIDPGVRRAVQEDRKLGLAILKGAVDMTTISSGEELKAVDDVLTLRSWCLEKTAYGNLILAIVAEESAVTLLLRSLADPKVDLGQIQIKFDSCSPNGPTSAYWLQVLDQEKYTVNLENFETILDSDYIKLAAVFESLFKRKAAECQYAVFPGSGGDYAECYVEFDPAQVGWLVTNLSIRKSALKACIAVKQKLGIMPENREEFRLALKKNASAIMKNEDRLGGRIDSGQVWAIWCDALGK